MTSQAELDRSTRLSKSTECPVEGCGKSIPRGHLMCPAHWRLVPGPLKTVVRESARGIWRPSDEGDDLAPYRRWRADALEAIRCVEEGEHA